MVKGVIWDFDGTLFDSMPVWYQAGFKYLEALGIKGKEGLDEILRTMNMKEAAFYIKNEYNLCQPIGEVICGFNRIVEKSYMYDILPKPGVEKLLNLFSSEGIHMCIATVTDHYLIEAAINRCGLQSFFDGILTCSKGGYSKREPFIFRDALELMKTDKSNTLVLDDSAYALKTAKDDGFITVGVYDRLERDQDILKKYSDYFLQSFEAADGLLKFMQSC